MTAIFYEEKCPIRYIGATVFADIGIVIHQSVAEQKKIIQPCLDKVTAEYEKANKESYCFILDHL